MNKQERRNLSNMYNWFMRQGDKCLKEARLKTRTKLQRKLAMGKYEAYRDAEYLTSLWLNHNQNLD